MRLLAKRAGDKAVQNVPTELLAKETLNRRQTMFHRKPLLLLIAIVSLIATASFAQEQKPVLPKGVTFGPATVNLGSKAKINLPEGHVFLDGETTRARFKSMGEPITGSEVGMLASTNAEWVLYFDYDDSGHIMDDEKDKLDADGLLKSIKAANDEGNKERVSNGNPPLDIVGWEQPPHYDESTHNLTWAIRCTVQGRAILNYNTRLLGREGVMEVVLVCEPDQLQATMPSFKNLLAGYSFQTGQTYAEYKKGDKLAKYGLGALVLGGAAVGAAKLGLLAWLLPFLKKGWILIVAAFAAIGNFFRKLFGKGRKDGDQSS